MNKKNKNTLVVIGAVLLPVIAGLACMPFRLIFINPDPQYPQFGPYVALFYTMFWAAYMGMMGAKKLSDVLIAYIVTNVLGWSITLNPYSGLFTLVENHMNFLMAIGMILFLFLIPIIVFIVCNRDAIKHE